MDFSDKVITGWWDGEPIWRYKSPEERLREARITPQSANLYIALQEENL